MKRGMKSLRNSRNYIIRNMFNKNTFLVFDSFIDIKRISLPACKTAPGEVYLFPLTSKTSVIKAVCDKIKQNGYTPQVLPSAEIISRRDENVRDRYIKFVSDLPEKVCFRGKNLKESFAVDKDLSLWWLSLIAEKNVYKSDSFNCLVRMESIVSEISRREISGIIFSGRSLKLKKTLLEVSRKRNLQFKTCPIKYRSMPRELVSGEGGLLWVKHVFAMKLKSLFMTLRTLKVKIAFIFLPKKRLRVTGRAPIMIITPYPDLDEDSAKKGVFKNKYFVNLPEALEKENKQIVWISMYVRNKAVSFNESLKYARSFIKNGGAFFMLEEFHSFAGSVKAFLKMMASGIKFVFLKNRIRKASEFGTFNIWALFEDDWYSSFAGAGGYYGLVSYYAFRKMFKAISPETCLFPSETRSWEKALISAGSGEKRRTTLLACQSGTVPKMHLNFFNHPDELDRNSYPMPRADKILCNGSLPLEYMIGLPWPKEKMCVVEALRYMYLKEIITRDYSALKKKRIILLLSISAEESSSILSVSYEAFKDMKDVEVWIKPHPFLNLDKVFVLAGVSKHESGFEVKEGSLKEFLPEAWIAVTGESSAAIEALAFGCRVLIVNTPEWINLSPLRFVDTDLVDTVNSPRELKQKVVDICEQWDLDSRFRGNDKERYEEEKRRVVNKFFCLGAETDVPERFMEVLKP